MELLEQDKKHGAMCVYDFTLHEHTDNPQKVLIILSTVAKKFTMQLEKGEKTGKLHYQGRLSLKVKKRLGELIQQAIFANWHLSITSAANRTNDFYVLKEDTRVDGPWTEEDVPKVIKTPWDVVEYRTYKLRPYQEKIPKLATQIRNLRITDIIYDPSGCIGKTMACRDLVCKGIARILPFVNDYISLMRIAADGGWSPCFLIDMPRAINKEKLGQLYSAIESLKGGYCFDDRYKFREHIWDPMNIICFTNMVPDLDLLSRDRWRIWWVDDNYDLLKYNKDIHKIENLERNKNLIKQSENNYDIF